MKDVVVVVVVLDLFIRRRGQRNTWCSALLWRYICMAGDRYGGAGFVYPKEPFDDTEFSLNG